MSDDLIEAMSEAIYRVHEPAIPPVPGQAVRVFGNVARATRDAIIAHGGVTEDDVRDATGWVDPDRERDEVRDLVARAIATACAERDAEIERLTRRLDLLNDDYDSLAAANTEHHTRAERAEAERDKARAEKEWQRATHDALAAALQAERDELRAEVERLRANGNLYLTRAHTAEGLLRAVLDREADR